MKRNAILLFAIILNLYNPLYSQSTQEFMGSTPIFNDAVHPSSISWWNNEKVISGTIEQSYFSCGLIKIDPLSWSYYMREFGFDYYCDAVSSSASLGNEFAITGTLADVSNGIYPRPFFVLADTLNNSAIAFAISDTSLFLQIRPKIGSTSDGGFILSWTAGNGETRIVKFNHVGVFVWGYLLSTSGIFYVDDLAIKNDGKIILAGRNSTSQGLQPTLITLDTAGQILRTKSIAEQQSEPVSIAVSNNIAMVFCTPDPTTTYNKLNLLLFNQNDSLLSGNSYVTAYSNYECTDLTMYNDSSWLITGNLFLSQGWPEIGFYFKGSTSIPLINNSYIGNYSSYTKFFGSLIDTNGTIWTAGDQGDVGEGLIVMTGLPVDDCRNLAFYSIPIIYNPNFITDTVTSQIYIPVLTDPHVEQSNHFNEYDPFCLSGIHENANINSEVTVFPNPVTTSATFKITDSEENKTLIIYDQLGKEIWRKETVENQIEFSTEGFASGLYFYRIEQEGKSNSSGKFIIQ